MADELTDEELGLDSDQMEALDPNIRKELREARKMKRERDQALQQAEQSKRELAFTQAGFPESPLGKQLAKSYDGEISVEAIKAYGAEMGVVGERRQEIQQTVTPQAEEFERLRRMQQTGYTPPTPNALTDYQSAVRGAKSEKEVLDAVDQFGAGVGVGIHTAD